MPQVLLQPAQPLHSLTRQSRGSEAGNIRSDNIIISLPLTLLVAIMLLLSQSLLPSQFSSFLFLLVAHIVTHNLPVHIGLGHHVQLALALAREHGLFSLAEVLTRVFLLEKVVR